MWAVALDFGIGAILAHLIVRIPFLTFPRARSWNEQFPPHPEAIKLDTHLIQRIMHMRAFYWLALVFATIPLGFGWASLGHGSAPMGFGMWTVGGWVVVSRITLLLAGEEASWSKDLAMRVQNVKNISESDQSCCSMPSPHWEVTAIRCITCGKILLNEARPDLGRPRSDGKIKGLIRLLLTDGKPVVVSSEDESDDSEE